MSCTHRLLLNSEMRLFHRASHSGIPYSPKWCFPLRASEATRVFTDSSLQSPYFKTVFSSANFLFLEATRAFTFIRKTTFPHRVFHFLSGPGPDLLPGFWLVLGSVRQTQRQMPPSTVGVMVPGPRQVFAPKSSGQVSPCS